MITYKVLVNSEGNREWYMNDKLHREDGPAVEYFGGDKEWYINGERHRLDGPAIEDRDGYKAWYLNGKRHRLDGPAVEFEGIYKEWYIEGNKLTQDEFNRQTAPAIEYTVAQLEELLGKRIKIVGE